MSGTTRQGVALDADVVGYSRLLADDREGTTVRMEEARRLVEGSVGGAGGSLVTFVGDSFMAIFDDVFAALRTAIAITTELELRESKTPSVRRLRFRMGLDMGEIVTVDGQRFGDALNIAARIQALAPQGGIAVSGRVYRALDEPALRFRPLGSRGLKNIPEEVEVYEFADLPTEGEEAGDRRSSLSLAPPTVALLPIHTESLEPSDANLGEIFRAEMLHRLTRVPSLRVIDARAEGGGHIPDSARYMIESGAHRAEEKLRVYATVVDVTTMNVVSSHRWMLTGAELIGRSDDLVEEVARSVEVELIVGEPAGLYADLEDPEAIQDVYLGWYHLTAATPAGWTKSLDFFGKVAKAHPELPYGRVLLAFAYWMGANSEWAPDPDTALAKSYELAKEVGTAGDPTGMARMVEAAVLMSRGLGDEALQAIEGAEIIRPTCDATYGLEGSVRRYLGQFDRSVELEDQAMSLTGVTKPWYPTVKACSLYMSGQLEQSASLMEMVLEHHPDNLEGLLVLAAAQAELGLARRARATADALRKRYPSVDVDAWLESRPYADRDQVRRWRTSLVEAGVLAPA